MQTAPVHSSGQLIERATAIAKEGRKKTVVVAAAQDADVIGAISQAQADGFVDSVLMGDERAIRKLSEENDLDIGNLEVVDIVAGQADILLAPNIETVNGIYRAMAPYGRAQMGGVLIGGKVPVALGTRSDSAETKFHSIVLGVLVA